MVHVIPLGGLGEIGLNAMVIACRGEMLLIDAGLMFPTSDLPGVDIIVPDFSYLKQNTRQVKGILLTHGHEDHVGALPFLLEDVSVPVYGTRFTLALVRHRLEEMGIRADLREIEPREPFKVGSVFNVEASRVTHTVPDAVGFIVRTPEGTLLHTGDFKLDPDPIDGLRTDLERWGEIGEEGLLCLMSDSTNSEVLTETGSERDVQQTFERLFQAATGRIVVAMFSSHLHRMRHVMQLAERLGRKVLLLGRSLIRNVEMARSLGYLPVSDELFISPEASPSLPANRLVVLSTGSQAEARAGLSQLATGDGPVRLEAGDLVVVSARAIPGNERGVGGLIDRLIGRGATVAYSPVEPGIHVSGHASQPQQRRVLELVKPQAFVPVHGELRHLKRHSDTARETGLTENQIFMAQDGDVLSFENGRGRFDGSVNAGRIFRDRFGPGALTQDAVQERNRMAETGVLVAAVVIDRENLSLMAGPQISGQGLSQADLGLLGRVADEARRLFLELPLNLRRDDAAVREELAKAVRRAFKQLSGKRPVVLPLVVKV